MLSHCEETPRSRQLIKAQTVLQSNSVILVQKQAGDQWNRIEESFHRVGESAVVAFFMDVMVLSTSERGTRGSTHLFVCLYGTSVFPSFKMHNCPGDYGVPLTR